MMPLCRHNYCRRVSTKTLGRIDVPNNAAKTDDNPNGMWPETVYVCDRHYERILRLLGFGSKLKEES